MQPVNGPGSPIARDRPLSPTKTLINDQPLSPAQRIALEKIIVKIMALSPVKSADIWAALRHDLSLDSKAELMSRHFLQAEHLLVDRLTQAQQHHARIQLRQQLTELLPQGNNRQIISDFIRQQFGHTALNQLNLQQLQQVWAILQSSSLASSSSQQSTLPDRPLLPAEHQNIQLLVTKLSTATGEQTHKIWQSLFDLLGVKNSGSLPARHFQLISQFLQIKFTLSQQIAPTLIHLQSALKQPADRQEQQLLTDYCLQRFQAIPSTPLTQMQINTIINLLFANRLDRTNAHLHTPQESVPIQPLFSPWMATLSASLQPVLRNPSLIFITLTIVMSLLIAIFI